MLSKPSPKSRRSTKPLSVTADYAGITIGTRVEFGIGHKVYGEVLALFRTRDQTRVRLVVETDHGLLHILAPGTVTPIKGKE